MKRVLAFVLVLLFCSTLCACDSSVATENETINENLQKYGEEFANCDNPAQEIAWSLAQLLYDELYQYDNDIELNPSEFDLDQWNIDTEISEFGEKLQMCVICCQPKNNATGEFCGVAWIRVAWSSKTQELRNIYIMSNINNMDNGELIRSVFHNSPIDGMGDVYDELRTSDLIEISGCSIRLADNIVSFEIPSSGYDVTCNIDFLPHSVHVEHGELYDSNGKRVSIDIDWVYTPAAS